MLRIGQEQEVGFMRAENNSFRVNSRISQRINTARERRGSVSSVRKLVFLNNSRKDQKIIMSLYAELCEIWSDGKVTPSVRRKFTICLHNSRIDQRIIYVIAEKVHITYTRSTVERSAQELSCTKEKVRDLTIWRRGWISALFLQLFRNFLE